METRWKDANPLCATPNGEYKKEHIYIFFFQLQFQSFKPDRHALGTSKPVSLFAVFFFFLNYVLGPKCSVTEMEFLSNSTEYEKKKMKSACTRHHYTLENPPREPSFFYIYRKVNY